MKIILYCLILAFLSLLSYPHQWHQYTRPKYFLGAQNYSTVIPIPDQTPLKIDVITNTKLSLSTQIYDQQQDSFTGQMNGMTNNPFLAQRNIGSESFLNLVFKHPQKNPDKAIVQISNKQGELLKRQLIDDFVMPTVHSISYFINTTSSCTIKATLKGHSFDELKLYHPSIVSSSLTLPTQTVSGSHTQKILTANLEEAGVWVLQILSQSGEPTEQILRELTLETASDHQCQNLCFGEASERGSLGWDFSGQKCLCEAGLYHNPYYGCGKANCSKTNLDYSQSSPDECICPQNTIWNLLAQKCTPDCQMDSGSTGIYLKIGQCQCINNFYWHSDQNQCIPNCNQVLGSHPLQSDTGKIMKQCQCKSPAIWNQTRMECYLPCEKVLLSTGQQERSMVCECKTNANWHPGLLTCEANCSKIQFSTGLQLGRTSCECQEGFRWDESRLECSKVCVEDAYTTGVAIDEKCECKNNGIWSQFEMRCIKVECPQKLYSLGSDSNSDNCLCAQNFEWNPIIKQCVLLCHELEDSLSLHSNSHVHQCLCKSGSYWEQLLLRCLYNCSQVEGSTGVNINFQQCQCQEGYSWNSQDGTCQPQCTKISQTGLYDQIQHHCQCKQQYAWSTSYKECLLKCQIIEFAYSIGDDLECACTRDLIWHESERKCKPSCLSQYDDKLGDSGEICDCKINTIWSAESFACIADCSKNLSISIDGDKCTCKEHALWNEETNECECEYNYEYNQETKQCQNKNLAYACIAGFLGLCGSSISGMKFNFWIRDRKNDNDDFDIMDDTLIRQTVRDTEVTGTIASMIKKVSEAE